MTGRAHYSPRGVDLLLYGPLSLSAAEARKGIHVSLNTLVKDYTCSSDYNDGSLIVIAVTRICSPFTTRGALSPSSI